MASVAREFLEKNFQRTIINQNFHEKKYENCHLGYLAKFRS